MSVFRKCLWTVGLLLVACCLPAQQIDRIEYFFDQDPGYGNGITLPISPSQFISNTFNIGLPSFGNGVHHLHFRAQDSLGRWSLTHHKPFFFLDVATFPNNPNILQIEYFFDQDPGYGNGTQVVFTPADSVSMSIPVDLNNLSNGIHFLSFRAKSENGWSMVETHLIFVYSSFLTNTDEVVEMEYYFDHDPGYGNGNPIAINPDSLIDLTVNIDISALSVGIHHLNIRSKSGNGQWSLTETQPFLKGPFSNYSLPNKVEALEYFIDQDPGFGNGQAIPITPDTLVDVSYNIDLSALSQGMHRFLLRSRSSNGLWSIVQEAPFMVWPGDTSLARIVAAEYFFDQDPGYGNGISIPLDSSFRVDTLLTIDTTGLSIDTHRVFIRIKDNLQRWSLIESFRICHPGDAVAGFDIVEYGHTISFVDTSTHAASYLWNLGNGLTDTVSHPIQTYSPGTYQVQLIISNFCSVDTFSHQLTIRGVESFSPGSGGNLGDVIMDLYGGGFDSLTTVKLKKLGQPEILPTHTVLLSPDRLSVEFDLRGQVSGLWDLEVGFQNSAPVVFPNGFEIKPGEFPDMWTNIIGPSVVRPGLWNDYEVQLGNTGNMDAKGIPLYIAIPPDADVEFDFEIVDPVVPYFDYDTFPAFGVTDSIYGQPFPSHLYVFFIPFVRSNSSSDYHLRVKYNSAGNTNLASWTHPPMFSSPFSPWVSPCWDGIIDVVSGVGSMFLPDLAGCIYGAGDLTFGLFIDLIYNKDKIDGLWAANLIHSTGNVLYSCATTVVPATKAVDLFVKGVNLTYNVIAGQQDSGIRDKLEGCFEQKPHDSIPSAPFDTIRPPPMPAVPVVRYPVNVVNSFDPNDKLGPKGPGVTNFVGIDQYFYYTVRFENVDSATAAAQIVWVTDTLKDSIFDFSSFELESFQLGDTTFFIPPKRTSWTQNISLANLPGAYLRVNTWFDDSSGVVNWSFVTIDSATRELVTNPFAGFLPPNVNPPEGEGSVSFSIQQRDSLNHGTVFDNKASIIFDSNPEIITNQWENTLDTISPVTSMTALPSILYDPEVTVTWNSTDQGAGLAYYNLYMSTNGGQFELVAPYILDTAYLFQAEADSSYAFFCEGVDSVRNREIKPGVAEVSFTYLDTCQTVFNVIDTTICDGDSLLGYTIPGIYIDSFLVSTGCDSVREIILSVFNPLPLPNIIPIGTDSLMCSATGQSYNWYLNGNLINPQSNQILASVAGVYTVSVTDSNGCQSALSGGYSHLGTGSLQHNRNERIQIVPNPSDGKFRLLNIPEDSGEIVLKISNTMGKKVLMRSYSRPGEILIDLLDQPAGIYWWQVSTENNKFSGKVLILK